MRNSEKAMDSRIEISRPVHLESELEAEYRLDWTPEQELKDAAKQCCAKTFACTSDAWKKRILGLFPFINIMREYQWKKWLHLDVISGLSVGGIHIPQSMGFALLSAVPPWFGLYSSIFPVIIYFFFGTSRHISMGTMALISLMTGTVVDREVEKYVASIVAQSANITQNGTVMTVDEENALRVDVAMSVSLLVGCFQILMSFINFNKVTLLMSASFMGGYLNGAAVHIIGSQLIGLFGQKVKNPDGTFRIPRILYMVFIEHILETNVATLVTGLICMVILVIIKEVINVKCIKWIKVPIPAELLILILGTVTSHFANLHEVYDVKVIGTIPQGIPAPRLPSMTNASTYAVECIIIAIISFAISISMVNMMAAKHNYAVDDKQEMLAYGIAHTVGSMLNSFAGCQAPPRTLVHEGVGGKTQLSSLVSCAMVFLVCMVVGPYLKSLPVPVLAAIITVALLPLFKQFANLGYLWRVSKCDFLTFLLTFIIIVVFDITIGLVAGIFINLAMVVFQVYITKGHSMQALDNTEIYIPSTRLISGRTANLPNVKIFRFQAPIFYMNVAKFKAQLMATTLNPFTYTPIIKNVDASSTDHGNGIISAPDKVGDNCSAIQIIIIDCSSVTYIDLMGLNLIKNLHKAYDTIGISLRLACVSLATMEKLRLIGLLPQLTADSSLEHNKDSDSESANEKDELGNGKITKGDPAEQKKSTISVYPTIHDAVMAGSIHSQYECSV